MSALESDESPELDAFAQDLRAGLLAKGQRVLPSKYLYDEVGSSLFEVITVLPEYGLTRADTRLLRRHVPDWVETLPPDTCVVELGSGSSKKTRIILEQLSRRQSTQYFPIDISVAALSQCSRELSDVPNLVIQGLHSDYLHGLQVASANRINEGPLLILFLGSTIGNFERHAGVSFLRSVRQQLRVGDLFFLSTDLVKNERDLIRAYDDDAGVTAAFNKNVLARINRELSADFDLSGFAHRAKWNRSERRIEMHLEALRDMVISIRRAKLDLSLCRGETIKTEDCYKFERAEVIQMGSMAGFTAQAQWVDPEWPFAQTLLSAI